MRALYTFLAALALPFASLVIVWRGVRERSYWQGWAERFGRGAALPGPAPGFWVHAVSVGEVQAAIGLVAALRHTWPAGPVVVTSATPTGRARARAALDADVEARYAPYDLPWCVRAAMRRFHPALLIVMETELWPNLLQACSEQHVPVIIASARLSEKSAARWKTFSSLLQPSLAHNVTVAAQSPADARRFESLGVPASRIHVSGNIKFDRAIPPAARLNGQALRVRYASARPLWVAGSTHPGEEKAVLAAHTALRAAQGDALLVMAPRHPARFDEAAKLIEASGESWMRLSGAGAVVGRTSAQVSVLLLDTLGELENFYAAADLAFVGGSLVPIGGHNLLEPAALGVATLSGPHQHSAPDIARLLAERHGLLIVENQAQLAAEVVRLMGNAPERARMGEAARAVVSENQGALERVLAIVSEKAARVPRRAEAPRARR